MRPDNGLPPKGRRSSYSVGSWSPMILTESARGTYRTGYVVTPHGVVGIYDQSGTEPYTTMDVAVDGRAYSVSWKRKFSDRYLKALAKRFAALVAWEAL